jgi:hypothetical protein
VENEASVVVHCVSVVDGGLLPKYGHSTFVRLADGLYCAVRSQPPAECSPEQHRCVRASKEELDGWLAAAASLKDRLGHLQRLHDQTATAWPQFRYQPSIDELRRDRYRGGGPSRIVRILKRLLMTAGQREHRATVERLYWEAVTAFDDYRRQTEDVIERLRNAHARAAADLARTARARAEEQVRQEHERRHERYIRERNVVAGSVRSPSWACMDMTDGFIIFHPELDTNYASAQRAMKGLTPKQVDDEYARRRHSQYDGASIAPNTARALVNWFMDLSGENTVRGVEWSAWSKLVGDSIRRQERELDRHTSPYPSIPSTDVGTGLGDGTYGGSW